MVQDIREEYVLPLVVLEFVEGGTNTNHPIDLGDVLQMNISFHTVNKITSKWSEPKRCPCIPNQNYILGIFVLTVIVCSFIQGTITVNSQTLTQCLNIFKMFHLSKLVYQSWKAQKILRAITKWSKSNIKHLLIHVNVRVYAWSLKGLLLDCSELLVSSSCLRFTSPPAMMLITAMRWKKRSI